MRRPVVRWLALASLALLITIPPAVAPVRAADRQLQPSSAGTPALSLKITLPTQDLSAGSVHATRTGFTLTLTNHLTVFYSVNPAKSDVTSSATLWGRGLLGPKQSITLSVPFTSSGQGVLLQLNPTTLRAVTLDELFMAINLVEVYLGLDVDPVAVLDAAPDLISAGAELLGLSDYSAPLGALQQLLAANSLPDRERAIVRLSTSLTTVLAKPALVKRLAPLLAQGLSAASHTNVTLTSVKTAMTQLTPVLTGLSRLIVGGRIGAMFLDFGKLIAERVTSPDNNAFAPLIPLRLTVTSTPIPVHNENVYDDEFSSPTLNPKWQWVVEGPPAWSLTERPGFLRIYTANGDINGGNNNAPVLVEKGPEGDFEISTYVEIKPTVLFQQASLLMYADDDNYVKVAYIFESGTPEVSRYDGTLIEFGVETNGNYIYQQIPISSEPPGYYLQIDKNGANYTGFVSADGTHWAAVATYANTAFTPDHIGLMAISPGAPSIPADYDFVHERILSPQVRGPLPAS